MSDLMKDIVKDGYEGVKNSIHNKFGRTLISYIIASWIAYNWSNIALLFMSKAIVEQRIQDIYQLNDLYPHYFWEPIGVGLILAFVGPAFSFTYTFYNQYLTVKQDDGLEYHREKNKLKVDLVKLKSQEARIKTSTLQSDLDKLKEEVRMLQQKRDTLALDVEYNYDSILSHLHRSWNLIREFKKFKEQNPNMTESNFIDFYEKKFDSFDIQQASKERENIKIMGHEALSIFDESKPMKADPELVKELLYVTGIRSMPKPSEAAKNTVPDRKIKTKVKEILSRFYPQN